MAKAEKRRLTLITEGSLPGSPLETLNDAVLHRAEKSLVHLHETQGPLAVPLNSSLEGGEGRYIGKRMIFFTRRYKILSGEKEHLAVSST